MTNDGLPPGGAGADGEDLPNGNLPNARNDGGAPAGTGVDDREEAFEQRGRSRRQERNEQRLLRDRAYWRERALQAEAQRDHATRAVDTAAAQNLDSQLASLRAQKLQAFNAGDAEADAALTEQISAMVTRKELMALRQTVPAAPASQPTFSAETEDWIERNPRFNTDPQFRATALAADKAAQQLGYVPDSPEYFQFVEDHLERKMPGSVNRTRADEESELQAEAAPIQTHRPPANRGPAPVTQRPAAGRQPQMRVGDAIPRELRAKVEEGARTFGQPVAEYWASLRRMAQDGKVDLSSFRS